MKKKKWLIGTLLILTVLIIGGGGIYTYLSDGDNSKNDFTVGSVNTEIVEEFTPPTKLEPGIRFTKDVKVRNLGPNDCYIRIKAVFTDSDMGDSCEVDWNTDDFVYNEKDGYYYYKEIVKAEEFTESLFTTVTLSTEILPEEIKDFNILIYSEAYQTGGKINGKWREFTGYEEAWTYYQNG